MRLIKLIVGFVLLLGGVFWTYYFIAHINEFNGGESANSILVAVPLSHDGVPVGFFMNLVLAIAGTLIAVAGFLLIRNYWKEPYSNPDSSEPTLKT